jgi:hypothetical protein
VWNVSLIMSIFLGIRDIGWHLLCT